MRSFILLLFMSVALFALDAVVSPKWLNDHITDANLRVVHVGSVDGFEDAHIPNAMQSDIEKWRVDNGTFLVLRSKSEIEQEISRLGINANSTVVLYAPIDTPKDLLKASYIYWALDIHGVKNVGILDGGMDAWKYADYKLTTMSVAHKPTNFKASIDTSKVADLEFVKANINKLPMVDARPADMYLGITPTPTVKRDGHIKGAMSYTWIYSLNSDYTMKDRAKLEDLFVNGYNLAKDKEVLVYCTGGLETSFNYFVLNGVLGYKKVRLYDASMKEWGNREDTPINSYFYEVFKQ